MDPAGSAAPALGTVRLVRREGFVENSACKRRAASPQMPRKLQPRAYGDRVGTRTRRQPSRSERSGCEAVGSNRRPGDADYPHELPRNRAIAQVVTAATSVHSEPPPAKAPPRPRGVLECARDRSRALRFNFRLWWGGRQHHRCGSGHSGLRQARERVARRGRRRGKPAAESAVFDPSVRRAPVSFARPPASPSSRSSGG